MRRGAGVPPAVAGASRPRARAGCPRDSGQDARTTWRRGAQTCHTTARLRHPWLFFMGFRGPKAQGERPEEQVCATQAR